MKSLLHAGDLVVRYVAWLAVFAAGLVVIQVLRANLFNILIQARLSPYAVPFFVNAFVVVCFACWLAIVIWLENYLTGAPSMADFWRRLLRVLAPMAGIALTSYLIDFVLRVLG